MSQNEKKPKSFKKCLIVFGLTVLLIIVTILSSSDYFSPNQAKFQTKPKLKYLPIVLNDWNVNDNSRTMKRVLNKMSWQMVNSSSDDWDLMWSIDFPFFEFEDEIKNLKPHQRVNHFPGISSIAMKKYMVTNNRFPFIPPAFTFPHMIEEFKNYVKSNPEYKFVEKLSSNRGVKIVPVDEIKFDNSEKFYQRFIDNPFLIDGHAFDFAVYVLISSIDPLRIYRYRGEILSRVCPEPFYPFDPENLDKYVVGDEIKLFFDMPSVKKLCTEMGYSYIQAFEHHIKSRGYNMSELYRQIDEAIIALTLRNEQSIIKRTLAYDDPSHFFELMRFDFIIDENFKAYLMEAQMSPNLVPPMPSYEPNSVGYEQVVYTTLRMIGAENYHSYMFRFMDNTSNRMISSFKNIAVDIETCSRAPCDANCALAQCSHCIACISDKNMNDTQQAYQEHMRRGDMMRIFPSELHYGDEFIKNLSPANQFSVKWYKKMCEVYKDFC